ncbi:hypothetical protein IQ266_09775 [filamentous cyanobacterium LEGE 11480]|uniref:NB-ARC domain-containing protein n=1 Tax=Romeriopsis navalis LEGE 11480 TaxID=2777977 RepID=A0A928VKI3_9CYAN|nr:NB-ARC domain-containing protein [Romeriopsis navalis]MBE9030015.1 hypothetical protein [Romeriopsis navalis LEGE 11480]
MSNKAQGEGHTLGCLASTSGSSQSILAFPDPISHFIGRDRELQAIERLFKQGINVVELTDSPGKIGMGKSALAIQAVHALKSHYSDCQLYANLHGQDTFPAHARDVLQEWLVLQFGIDPRVLPQDTSELQALYQQQIEGQRVIIVLDNVASLKQIQPLVAHSSSQSPTAYAILITSRSPILTAEHGKTLFVDRLATNLGMSLLTGKPASQTPSQAEGSEDGSKSLHQIIKLADGSPFALQLLGHLLRQVPPTSPDTLMLEIEKGKRKYQASYPEQLSQFMACLNVAYQSLEVEDRDLLSRLSVLHGSQFNAGLAAHLCGQNNTSIVTLRLETLHKKGWLVPMPNLANPGELKEYTMPEVARAFLWKKVTAKARRTLVTWALNWTDDHHNEIDRLMLKSDTEPIADLLKSIAS